MKIGNPFANNCVKSINTLGKLIIISSILVPIESNIFELCQFRMFNIDKILISSNFISNIGYTFSFFDISIFIFGIIILILCKLFEYGYYLQEEYDSLYCRRDYMSIIIRLDKVLADRKLQLKELSD